MSDSSYEERAAALRSRLDEPAPESVRFSESGDEVVGIFHHWDRGVTTRGDAWIAVLESTTTPGRFASVWVFHTALQSQLQKANPQPGDLIAIRYLGLRQPAHGGESYHDYKVVTETGRPTAAPPWVGAPEAPAAPLDTEPPATAGSPGGEGAPDDGAYAATDDIPF